MPTSPRSIRTTRSRVAAGVCIGAVIITGFAVSSHADDGVIQLIPPSTTAPTPTAAPTTAPPTTQAPLPTLPTSTAAPTTLAPTIVPTEPPTTAAILPSTPSTTKKPKPSTTQPDVNPNATGTASIEVDISRQTLYFRRGGTLVRALHVSTGSGRHFCNGGKCQTAHTPRGRFRIRNRVNGWRTSSLGRLYNPLYFSGGYAIHGAGSVPRYPASHGCVRITISSANWLVRFTPNGTPVWVHD